MKYLLVVDVHGNYEALTAVLTSAPAAKCDAIFCLGDVVGYGPRPGECLNLLRAQNTFFVRGNHDHEASTKDMSYLKVFSSEAAQAMTITRELLTNDQKNYLAQMPTTLIVNGAYTLFHGAYENSI